MSQKRHKCTIQQGTQSLSYVLQKSSNLFSLRGSADGSFPQEESYFSPVFMVRMQSLCQQKERMCTFWQFKFDIFWINHTVHMCQGLKSINLTLSIALNRCYYRLNTFPPTLELCLWVVRQLRWNWAKFAWYGHSAKLNYNCHLFSLTGLNCTWCVMAPALLEIARNDSRPVCSPREISAEWNDEGTCLKSEPFDSLQHPLKRQDLSCYGDFISTI